jgi:DMSO reductase iron-sulfur subunit
MALPLLDRAQSGNTDGLVRLTAEPSIFDLVAEAYAAPLVMPHVSVNKLIPTRELEEGEQYRFHFNMTKCIGCRSCEIACNEQNGNPAEIHWRRFGEIEGGIWPDTKRNYLSMGCNHCLDAECVKGCPVEAYTKDPLTGIVLHSAEACIGCQYCVWNCPYSVPQFNPERGVVGKCDMCHGRLTDGLEPACVNACPEAAIEIEIVDKAAWRKDYTSAESPGMPAAGHSLSTTRITLPAASTIQLERVDVGHIRPEHAHFSLVFMTTLMQAVSGAFIFELLSKSPSLLALIALVMIASVALGISAMHLGRPAYAWRAVKMWRRSWLSREVLLYGLFFGGLAAFTGISAVGVLPASQVRMILLGLPGMNLLLRPETQLGLGWATALLGLCGTICSAYIYLVPARPAWNMIHTPLDFLITTALLGSLLPSVLHLADNWVITLVCTHGICLPADNTTTPVEILLIAASLWFFNLIVRRVRLGYSRLFEHRASSALLGTEAMQVVFYSSFALMAITAVFAHVGFSFASCLTAFAAVFMARYLFFVSVVPLNMALTFVRGGSH